eukprot:371244_1
MAPMLEKWCGFKPATTTTNTNGVTPSAIDPSESSTPSGSEPSASETAVTPSSNEPQVSAEGQVANESATASESEKAAAFRKIVKKVKAGTGTNNHKHCKQFVSYNAKHDRLDCQCGTPLWRGKRHRADELFKHFKTCKMTTNNGDTSILKKLVNGSKDMMLKPLNYIFLYTTFVV